jgi:diguanylate cyclase (GGDEF)-like protein
MANGGATMEDELGVDAVDAIHDALTGFVNRGALALVVEYAIARARRDGECLTILCFVLERMDEINAKHGKESGDAALIEFGELMRGELRSSDVIARIGGDKFAVLLSGTDATQAGVVINHVTSVIRERNAEGGHPFDLRALVTKASFEPASELTTLDALLSEAIERMTSGRAVAVR